jgi:hypothetical protein
VGSSHARGLAAPLELDRSLAWLLANRRLTVRSERGGDILTAFLQLACALSCARKLALL